MLQLSSNILKYVGLLYGQQIPSLCFVLSDVECSGKNSP